MINDIRYAFRALRQNPVFAVTAILSIALAIGANSAIFSYADLLLFRPLSVPNPSQVVTLRSLAPSMSSVQASGSGFISYPDFEDFRDKNRSFDGLVAYNFAPVGFAPDPKAQSQLEMGMAVSGNFFDVLRITPPIGRGFRPEENQVPGRDAVVVLAYDFWKRGFGSDPSVVGRPVRLNGVEFVVIGVAPESFTGMDQWVFPSFYVPAMMAPQLEVGGADLLTNRARRTFEAKGRLKPGVSLRAAIADVSALASGLAETYPESNRVFGATVKTELQFRMERETGAGALVVLLISIVAVVLLIACANVANLMLGRGRSRAREIAVRLALGAGRRRVVQQLMMESLLIGLSGGVLALFVAAFAIEGFSSVQVPSDLPIRLTYNLDARVVWFTLLLSVGSAVVFGLVPALQSTKTDLITALKAGDAGRGRRKMFGRNALVMVQIAGSLALLMGAAQSYSNAASLLTDNHGFKMDHRMTMRFDPSLIGYSPEQTRQFYDTLTERSRKLPGIKSAALTFSLPMTWDIDLRSVVPEGYEFPKGKESIDVMSNVVDHNYFETLGMPILKGRGFESTDRENSPRVVVVNQAFAQAYLGENPIGKRLRLGGAGKPWAEVVGVAPTSKYISPLEPTFKYIYLPLSQSAQRRMTLVAETYRDPEALAGPIQELVRSIDPNMPVFRVQTLQFTFDNYSAKGVRGLSGMFASVGLMGLVMALVGLYAVVSYEVSRRTREIGIRMALGAARQHVMKMILRQSAKTSVTGIVIGAALTLAAGQALKAGLEIRFNPMLLALVALSLLLTTLLAAAIPARRASRINPQIALRQD